jgi:hypothetical protein
VIKFPATVEQLKLAGYRFRFSRECRLCGTPLEFWSSPTTGNKMPLEHDIVDSKFVLLNHWITCPKADEVRKRKPRTDSSQGDLF